MLELSDITVRYGPFLAVDKVSLHVDAGEIVGLVGPNGAGKSSLVKAVDGVVRPIAGRVAFGGKDLANVPTHERISLGISVVPEGRGLFANMSVEENLLMGGYPLGSKAQMVANIELVRATCRLDGRPVRGPGIRGADSDARVETAYSCIVRKHIPDTLRKK